MAKAVARLREAIDEPEFGDAAYGFGPGRSPHHARHAVRPGLRPTGMGSARDGDLSAFVDKVPHDPLCAILRKRINAGRGLEVIERWLKPGMLDGKARGCPEKGRPQGAVRSPRVANGSLHAVRATGCETVGQAQGRGPVVRARSADDVVMGCARAEDARRIKAVLPKRCAQYGRESNTEKPQLVACGRPQRAAAERQPGTFRLLGVVHSWGQTWRGHYPIKRKTEGKRLRRRLGAFGRWCRDHRHRSLQAQDALRCAQRRGYSQYDGVRCHSPCLDLVYQAATRAWRYWLKRRGGRKMTWRVLGRMMAAYPLPRPRIVKGWV